MARPRPSQGPLNVVDLPQSELLARPTLTIKATHSFSRRRATARRPDDPAIRDKSLLNSSVILDIEFLLFNKS